MRVLRYEPEVPMRKIAAILPLPIVLGLYACAAAGTADDDLGNDVLPPISDASSDATTVRKDSGPASPPKEAGASSSGDAGRRDSGTSSSSGSSSSSSSGGGSTAEACSFGQLADIVTQNITPTEADSCDDCPGTGNRCCVDGAGIAPSMCYQL